MDALERFKVELLMAGILESRCRDSESATMLPGALSAAC
jgi:hypothetical protein